MFSFLKRKPATHCVESGWSGLTEQYDQDLMITRRNDSVRHVATNTVLALQFHCEGLTGTVCLRRTSQTSHTK